MLVQGINNAGLYPHISVNNQSNNKNAKQNNADNRVRLNYNNFSGYISNPFNFTESPEILLRAYLDKNYINNLLQKNPKVTEILTGAGVKTPVICTQNVGEMMNTHLKTTKDTALMIANEAGISDNDKKILAHAAVMHDFGKVMIPREIISKTGKLNSDERRIIDTHALVGQELLKANGTKPAVIQIVGEHHNADSDNELCQILTTADIYSALREKRSYKPQMSNEQALKLMDEMVVEHKVNSDSLEALKASLKKSDEKSQPKRDIRIITPYILPNNGVYIPA